MIGFTEYFSEELQRFRDLRLVLKTKLDSGEATEEQYKHDMEILENLIYKTEEILIKSQETDKKLSKLMLETFKSISKKKLDKGMREVIEHGIDVIEDKIRITEKYREEIEKHR